MSWRSRPNAWAVGLLVGLAAPGRVAAQGWREVQIGGVGAFAKPEFAGVGAGTSWRDRRRSRLGFTAFVGSADGEVAGRGELAFHFLLDPAQREGGAVYGGSGIAVAVARDGGLRPFVLVVVGAENAPGGRRGSFVEFGFGGGVRLAVGMRWRKQNAPSR